MSRFYSLWKDKSFQNLFQDYEVIAEKDLYVNVNFINVSIPILTQTSDNYLNVFEETILKFGLEMESLTEKIAEYLCIDCELIGLIQHKLERKGYLNEDYTLTEKGKKYFEYKETVLEKNIEKFSFIFPKITDHYCYIQFKNKLKILRFNSVEKYDDYDTAICSAGSVGKEKTIEGVLIEDLNKLYDAKKRPSITQIRETIRKNTEFSNLIIDGNTPMDIPLNSESNFFHYKLVIIKNSNDVIVSNGHHLNDSVLVDFVKRFYPTCIKELYDMANVANNKVDNKNNNIKVDYRDINSKLSKLLIPPKEFTENRQRDSVALANNKLLQHYYSALEWAFYDVLEKKPLDTNVLKELALNGYEENAGYISRIYYDLFSIEVGNYSAMFEFSNANISRYIEDNFAEMNVVLPLLILQSKLDKTSLFHDLIKENSDFLNFISRLRYIRNSIHHGGDKLISYEEILDCYNYTNAIIKIIIPSYSQKNDILKNASNFDYTNQERINNISILSQKLGVESYHNLNKSYQNNLLDIVKLYSVKDGVNLVNSVYALLQMLLKNYAVGFLKVNPMPSSYNKNDCVRILSNEKFFGEEPPKSLTTVGLEMFKKSTRLDNSSLGAYMLFVTALAYKNLNKIMSLLRDEVDEILDNKVREEAQKQIENEYFIQKKLAENNNDKLRAVIVYVDMILDLRHHGNRLGLTLSSEKLDKIYNDLFQTIKLIGEI